MLLLAPLLIEFLFLQAGAVFFLLCLFSPISRSRALSIALWFPVFGLCVMANLLFVGLMVIARSAALEQPHLSRLAHIPVWSQMGSLAFLLLLLLGAAIATTVAAAHQWLIRRLTFPLFRLYATAVCAGIGSVFGWTLSVWRPWDALTTANLPMSLFCLIALVFGFGIAAWRWAGVLRSSAPASFTWLSSREFDGRAS